jgi:hypothetical protein
MKVKDVFTPGSLPTVTFIDDHIKEKQKILADAIEMGSVVISIAGPSKSGKTVFVENFIGKDNLLHITGAGVDEPNKLWKRVFDLIGTPLETTDSQEKSFLGNFTGNIKAEAGILIKAKGEIGASGSWGNKKIQSHILNFDPLQLLIKELGGTGFVLFIDDFHYITNEAQKEISEQIKEAIRNNVKIICASVPYHSDDVIRANPDLRGRTVNIDFDFWDIDNLTKIATKGFSELTISSRSEFIKKLAIESAGSPQLMQSLCLHSCFEADIRERSTSSIDMPHHKEFYNKVCGRTALTVDYSSIVDKLKDGPKIRGEERKKFLLKDGEQSDVYPLLLKAISQDPPQLTFRYANLSARISEICNGPAPSGSSIMGACNQMSNIANNAANQIVLEWDSDNDVLDLRDPYLLFYLRWT